MNKVKQEDFNQGNDSYLLTSSGATCTLALPFIKEETVDESNQNEDFDTDSRIELATGNCKVKEEIETIFIEGEIPEPCDSYKDDSAPVAWMSACDGISLSSDFEKDPLKPEPTEDSGSDQDEDFDVNCAIELGKYEVLKDEDELPKEGTVGASSSRTAITSEQERKSLHDQDAKRVLFKESKVNPAHESRKRLREEQSRLMEKMRLLKSELEEVQRKQKEATPTKRKNRTTRINCCPFCAKLTTNFPRHLIRYHPDEAEVKLYLSILDDDLKLRKRKRTAVTDELRKRGNYKYNLKIVNKELDGELLAMRRPTNSAVSTQTHVACTYCFGLFKKVNLYLHVRDCPKNSYHENGQDGAEKRKRIRKSAAVMLVPDGVVALASEALRKNVFKNMQGPLAVVAQSDSLIVEFGARYYNTHRDANKAKYTSQRMRDIARVYVAMKGHDESVNCFEDCFNPSMFDRLMRVVRELGEFDEDTGYMGVPSIAPRLCSHLKSCADIIRSRIVKDTSQLTPEKNQKLNEIERFLHLMNSDWNAEVGESAEKTRRKVAADKTSILPDEDELRLMSKNMTMQYGESVKLLEPSEPTATRLRRRAARPTQLHERGENPTENLASFVGHDLNVYKENYKSPLSVVEHGPLQMTLPTASTSNHSYDLNTDTDENSERSEDHHPKEQSFSRDKNYHPALSSEEESQLLTPKPPKFTRRRWTEEEKNSVYLRFARHIIQNTAPKRREIRELFQTEPALKNRTIEQVCTYVNNVFTGKVKIPTPVLNRLKSFSN